MDSLIAITASVLAWLVLPIWVHLLINTFVFGVVPPWIEKVAAAKGNTKFAMSDDPRPRFKSIIMSAASKLVKCGSFSTMHLLSFSSQV